jgi:hypothetical protein
MHYIEVAMGVVVDQVGILLFMGRYEQLARFGTFFTSFNEARSWHDYPGDRPAGSSARFDTGADRPPKGTISSTGGFSVLRSYLSPCQPPCV